MPEIGEFASLDNLAFWGKEYNIHYILGQDDWLFYARTMDGKLVYYVSEIDGEWWNAPHRGDCYNPATGLNCDGETKSTCRRDALYMLGRVWERANRLPWCECDNDPVSGEYLGWPIEDDRDFILNSRDHYLPYAMPVGIGGHTVGMCYNSDFTYPFTVDGMQWLIQSPAKWRS